MEDLLEHNELNGPVYEDLVRLKHLHNRYLLSFEPKNPHPGLHQIRVRLKHAAPAETVQFRSNYWAGGSNQ